MSWSFVACSLKLGGRRRVAGRLPLAYAKIQNMIRSVERVGSRRLWTWGRRYLVGGTVSRSNFEPGERHTTGY